MQNILTFIKNGQKFTLDASNIKSVRDTGNGFERLCCINKFHPHTC